MKTTKYILIEKNIYNGLNITLFQSFLLILPRVTDCKLVEDPRRFIAPQRYSPASVDARFLMDSDGVLTVPPEYLSLFVILRFCPFNNQYTDVSAGESCDTLTVQ